MLLISAVACSKSSDVTESKGNGSYSPTYPASTTIVTMTQPRPPAMEDGTSQGSGGIPSGPVGDIIADRMIVRTGDITMLVRSEEHTSKLQSQFHLVCRLLLEKKKTEFN